MVPAFVGVVLALVVALFARIVGLDRDRAFYPTVLAVIAGLYGLFAVIGGSTTALLQELVGTVVFLGAVVIGFRRSLWVVVAGLVGHGLFDAVHPWLIADPGVPAFWPPFCAAYDITAGAWLAVMLWVEARSGAPTLPAST